MELLNQTQTAQNPFRLQIYQQRSVSPAQQAKRMVDALMSNPNIPGIGNRDISPTQLDPNQQLQSLAEQAQKEYNFGVRDASGNLIPVGGMDAQVESAKKYDEIMKQIKDLDPDYATKLDAEIKTQSGVTAMKSDSDYQSKIQTSTGQKNSKIGTTQHDAINFDDDRDRAKFLYIIESPLFKAFDTDPEIYDYMTQDQKDVYNYIYTAQGDKKASQYIDGLKSNLMRQRAEAHNEKTAEFAKEHPILGSIGSVGVNIANALSGEPLVYGAKALIEPGEVDKNDPIFDANRFSHTTRETVQETYLHDPISQFIYNTTMGVGDAIPAIALSVVGTPAAGAAYMGLQAMGETAFDAKQRGASDGQALTLGVATGVISGALSMIPMGNLSSYSGAISGTVKAAAGSALKDVALVSTKKILSSVFLNAATSAINQAANELVDTAIMGNLSHYAVAVKNNMANGMTEKDARAKAFKDNMWNIVKSAGTGAVQGLVMGSIGLGVEAAKVGVGKIAGKTGALEEGTPGTGKASPEQSPLTEQQTADAVAGKPVQVESKAEPKTEIPAETLVNEIMPKAVKGENIKIEEQNSERPIDAQENSGIINENPLAKNSTQEQLKGKEVYGPYYEDAKRLFAEDSDFFSNPDDSIIVQGEDLKNARKEYNKLVAKGLLNKGHHKKGLAFGGENINSNITNTGESTINSKGLKDLNLDFYSESGYGKSDPKTLKIYKNENGVFVFGSNPRHTAATNFQNKVLKWQRDNGLRQ